MQSPPPLDDAGNYGMRFWNDFFCLFGVVSSKRMVFGNGNDKFILVFDFSFILADETWGWRLSAEGEAWNFEFNLEICSFIWNFIWSFGMNFRGCVPLKSKPGPLSRASRPKCFYFAF